MYTLTARWVYVYIRIRRDMGRVKTPSWDAKHELMKKHNISILWIVWEERRCYVRIDGVMKAQGWLLEYGPMDFYAERITLFLPD